MLRHRERHLIFRLIARDVIIRCLSVCVPWKICLRSNILDVDVYFSISYSDFDIITAIYIKIYQRN